MLCDVPCTCIMYSLMHSFWADIQLTIQATCCDNSVTQIVVYCLTGGVSPRLPVVIDLRLILFFFNLVVSISQQSYLG